MKKPSDPPPSLGLSNPNFSPRRESNYAARFPRMVARPCPGLGLANKNLFSLAGPGPDARPT